MKPTSWAGLAAAVTSALTLTFIASIPSASAAVSGYQPAAGWQETFSGPGAAPLDPLRWNSGGQRVQASASGLALALTSPDAANGSWINTAGKFAATYGTFSATVTAAGDPGVVPAFYLMSPRPGDCSEIDIMEAAGTAREFQTNYFSPVSGCQNYHNNVYQQVPFDISAGLHTYTLKWEPQQLQWLLDGKVIRTVTKQSLGTAWAFDQPLYPVFSIWTPTGLVSASGPMPQSTIEWAGGNVDPATLPQYLTIGEISYTPSW